MFKLIFVKVVALSTDLEWWLVTDWSKTLDHNGLTILDKILLLFTERDHWIFCMPKKNIADISFLSIEDFDLTYVFKWATVIPSTKRLQSHKEDVLTFYILNIEYGPDGYLIWYAMLNDVAYVLLFRLELCLFKFS